MADPAKLFDSCRHTPLPRAVYQLFLRSLNSQQDPSHDDLLLSGFISSNWKFSKSSVKFQKIVTQAHLKFQHWTRAMCIHSDDPNRLMCLDNKKMIIPEEEFPELIMKTHTCNGCPGYKHRGVGTTMVELSRTFSMGHRHFGMSENQLRQIIESCHDPHCCSWVARQRYRALQENKNQAKTPEEAKVKSLVDCTPKKDTSNITVKLEQPALVASQQDCVSKTTPQKHQGQALKHKHTSTETRSVNHHSDHTNMCPGKFSSKPKPAEIPYIDMSKHFKSHFDSSGMVHITKASPGQSNKLSSKSGYVSYSDSRGKVCIERRALEEVQRRKYSLSSDRPSGKQHASGEGQRTDMVDIKDDRKDGSCLKREKHGEQSSQGFDEDRAQRNECRSTYSKVVYANAHAQKKPDREGEEVILDASNIRRAAVTPNEIRSRVRSAQRSPARITELEIPHMPPKKVLYTLKTNDMPEKAGLSIATLNILGQKCDRNKACAIRGEYVLPPEPVCRSRSPDDWETTMPPSPERERSSAKTQEKTSKIHASRPVESPKKRRIDDAINESAKEISNLKVLIGKSPTNLSSMASVPLKVKQNSDTKKKSDSSAKVDKKYTATPSGANTSVKSAVPLVSLQNLVSAVGDKVTMQSKTTGQPKRKTLVETLSKTPVNIRPTVSSGMTTNTTMTKVPTALALPITITPAGGMSTNVTLPGQMKDLIQTVMSMQSKQLPSTPTAVTTQNANLPVLLTISPQGQIMSCHIQLQPGGQSGAPSPGVPALFMPGPSGLITSNAGGCTTVTTTASMQPPPPVDRKSGGKKEDSSELHFTSSQLIKDIVDDKHSGNPSDLEGKYGRILNRIHAVGRSLQPVVTGKKSSPNKIIKRIEEAKQSIDHMRLSLIERYGPPDLSVLQPDVEMNGKCDYEGGLQDQKEQKQGPQKGSNSCLPIDDEYKALQPPKGKLSERPEQKMKVNKSLTSNEQQPSELTHKEKDAKLKPPENDLKTYRIPETVVKKSIKHKTPYFREIPPLGDSQQDKTGKQTHILSKPHHNGKQINLCSHDKRKSTSLEPPIAANKPNVACESKSVPVKKSSGLKKSDTHLVTGPGASSNRSKHGNKKHKADKEVQSKEVSGKTGSIQVSKGSVGENDLARKVSKSSKGDDCLVSSSNVQDKTKTEYKTAKKDKRRHSHKESRRCIEQDTSEVTKSTHCEILSSKSITESGDTRGNKGSRNTTIKIDPKQDTAASKQSAGALQLPKRSTGLLTSVAKEKEHVHPPEANQSEKTVGLLASQSIHNNIIMRTNKELTFAKTLKKPDTMMLQKKTDYLASQEKAVTAVKACITDGCVKAPQVDELYPRSSNDSKPFPAQQKYRSQGCVVSKFSGNDEGDKNRAMKSCTKSTVQSETHDLPKAVHECVRISRDDTSDPNITFDRHSMSTNPTQSLKRSHHYLSSATTKEEHDICSPPMKKQSPQLFGNYSPFEQPFRFNPNASASRRGYHREDGDCDSCTELGTSGEVPIHPNFDSYQHGGPRPYGGNHYDNRYQARNHALSRPRHQDQGYQNYYERDVWQSRGSQRRRGFRDRRF